MEARSQIVARMYVVLTALCALPILVAVQVIGIHLKDGAELRKQGRQQAQAHAPIPAVRGAILDAKGRMLAVNTARHDLAIDPTFGDFDEHKSEFYQRLATVTGRESSYYRNRVASRPGSKWVALDRDLTERQRARIDAWDYPFVILETTFDRRYNYEQTLAHVLGHVNVDGTGAAGLELQYDEFLKGVDGQRERQRDAHGATRAMVDGGDVAPQHGESLVLTIDLVQQSSLEEALADGVAAAGASWGTAVAINPKTGAILALANSPTYDPNRPAAFSADAQRNRAITDQLEPGSTFKLVTAVAALETRAARLSDEVDTGNGSYTFGRRELRDTHANGVISFARAISLSSNIGIAKIAQNISPKKLYEYARNLGFGQRSWIDLPGEVSGTLKKPSDWSGTTRTSISIGYEVAVTPLQIANAYAAFANGGRLLQPFVVAERRDVSGDVTWRARPDSVRNAFKRRTAVALLEAFESVVTDGTATKARVEGIRIAGKTGTANKVIDGAYVRGRSRASFVGFFPAEDPEVVIVVMMDEPKTSIYGGDVSAPVFKRVVESWMPTLNGVHRRDAIASDDAPPVEAIPVPDVDGAPLAVARSVLRTAGLEVNAPRKAADSELVEHVEVVTHGRDLQIASVQVAPKSDTRRTAGTNGTAGTSGPSGTFRLAATNSTRPSADVDDAVATENQIMPDLTGLGARQAVYWLQANNIDVKIEGSGRVVSQAPRAGHVLSGEARLVCR